MYINNIIYNINTCGRTREVRKSQRLYSDDTPQNKVYNNIIIYVDTVYSAGRSGVTQLRTAEHTTHKRLLFVRRRLRLRRHIESDRRFTLTIVVALPSRIHTRTDQNRYMQVTHAHTIYYNYCPSDNQVYHVHFSKTKKVTFYRLQFFFFSRLTLVYIISLSLSLSLFLSFSQTLCQWIRQSIRWKLPSTRCFF